MTFHTKVGGAWKATTAWTKVSGVWKRCAVWTKVSGVWKRVSSLITLEDANGTALRDVLCTATVRVDSDGWVYESYADGTVFQQAFQWNPGGATPSDYEVLFTVTSGTATSNDASTYSSCGTDRSVTKNSGALDTPQTCSGTISIRQGATVLATSNFTLTAERYS